MPFGAEAARRWRHALSPVGAGATDGRLVLVAEAMRASTADEPRSADGWFEAVVRRRRRRARATRFRSTAASRCPIPPRASTRTTCTAPARSSTRAPSTGTTRDWRGRPWDEAVIYELHVGTFTPEGTFAAAVERLDHLAATRRHRHRADAGRRLSRARATGATTACCRSRPTRAYGTPDDLKRLVDAAHARGLMVLLDVVYNHFGPDGNYLHAYAPQFFNAQHQTPWGAAINFDGDDAATVRGFFIDNALYWLEEYRFDGLRLDAVHAIARRARRRTSSTSWRAAVRAGPATRAARPPRAGERHQPGAPSRPRPRRAAAARRRRSGTTTCITRCTCCSPASATATTPTMPTRRSRMLGRALAEGFAYQGEPSPYRDGERARRAERRTCRRRPSSTSCRTTTRSATAPSASGSARCADPRALRAALGVRAARAVSPMLFMGEEFDARDAVPVLLRLRCRTGRGRDARAGAASSGASRASPIRRRRPPSPTERPRDLPALQARLDGARRACMRSGWRCTRAAARRREFIVPRLAGTGRGHVTRASTTGLAVRWTLGDGRPAPCGQFSAATGWRCRSPRASSSTAARRAAPTVWRPGRPRHAGARDA